MGRVLGRVLGVCTIGLHSTLKIYLLLFKFYCEDPCGQGGWGGGSGSLSPRLGELNPPSPPKGAKKIWDFPSGFGAIS